MGGVRYGFTDEEKKGRFFRRSLFAVKDIAKGQKFTTENIKSIRPADGLKPKYLDVILGKKARGNIKKGTPLKLNMAA